MERNTTAPIDFQFFKKFKEPSQAATLNALQQGHAVLIVRKLYKDEAQAREYHPPKSPDDTEWANKLLPWFSERRHLYIACYHPQTSTLITSSAEPDKSITPWPLKVCEAHEPLATLDSNAVTDTTCWHEYDVAAIILNKYAYPTAKICKIIAWFRDNPPDLKYATHPDNGYDCQAVSRDILQIVNPNLNAKMQPLPNNTVLLAFHSQTSVLQTIAQEYQLK